MCMYAKLFHSCLTLCDPLDCILTVSSVHGILGKNTGVGCHFLLQEISPTQGQNPGLYTAGGFFTAEPPERPIVRMAVMKFPLQRLLRSRPCLRGHSPLLPGVALAPFHPSLSLLSKGE